MIWQKAPANKWVWEITHGGDCTVRGGVELACPNKYTWLSLQNLIFLISTCNLQTGHWELRGQEMAEIHAKYSRIAGRIVASMLKSQISGPLTASPPDCWFQNGFMRFTGKPAIYFWSYFCIFAVQSQRVIDKQKVINILPCRCRRMHLGGISTLVRPGFDSKVNKHIESIYQSYSLVVCQLGCFL